jgi:SAM-dependent methyltransferase
MLADLADCVVVDIGSGASRHSALSVESNTYVRLDYPGTNRRYGVPPDILGDAHTLPFASAAADAVLLLEVAEHLRDPHQALEEIHRVLREDGALYLSVPFLYPVHDAPHDFLRFTRFGLLELLRSHGFTPTRIIQHGNPAVTLFQLANLTLLEVVRDTARRSRVAALLLAIAAYPLTLIANLLAAPFLLVSWEGGACLGHFVKARRSSST